DYANELAQSFSRFYESTPILKAEGGVRNARVLVALAFKYTMSGVLKALGITPLERM
ncbi:DALR anticodon binding domain protein, partial [mine drainage metagenome]